MNGIYIFPIGTQIWKQISKCTANRSTERNHDVYHSFNDYGNDSEDGDISMSCANIAALVLSLFLAAGGLAYAVYTQHQKVSFYVQFFA